MGGKNCVIVDSDADLDEAVPAIVARAPSSTPGRSARRPRACSSTRRSPTRCSSASPARSRCSSVGQADTFGIDVPPVIEREAQERVERYRELARASGRDRRRAADGVPERRLVRARRPWPPTCPPTRPCSTRRSSARCSPSSACRDVDAACDRVDELPFALTGGLFCRNPHTVERVVRRTPGRQPLRQPPDHRRDGRPPAVRRQPPVGHRHQGRRPRLPAALRRAARGHREHGAPRPRDLSGAVARRATCVEERAVQASSSPSSGWKEIDEQRRPRAPRPDGRRPRRGPRPRGRARRSTARG